MTLGVQVRRAGFWTLDAARGSRIRRHLDDIRAKMAGEVDPESPLQSLLDHTVRTTPFYREIARPRLEAFPVVTRSMLQQHPEAFHSSAFPGPALRELTTSGSSGRPVTIRQDKDKRLRSIADTIHVNETFGHSVGDPLLWLRAWHSVADMRGLARRAQNVVAFEVRGLDDERKQAIIETLRDRRINAVLAYPSALSALVRFVEERGIDAQAYGLRVIINDSEAMSENLKKRLETTFGCPVADRYANQENGILASAGPGEHVFALNRASFLFEFLKPEADEAQVPGRPARVVVTDLYNHAMPLIRYDTGDLAVPADHDGPRAVAIRHLEGRSLELIRDSAGHDVSATMVESALNPFGHILQYQLRQEDTHAFRLLVCGAEGRYRREEFTDALRELLGSESLISVEFVTDIPAEKNGKTRTLVPLSDFHRPSPPATVPVDHGT